MPPLACRPTRVEKMTPEEMQRTDGGPARPITQLKRPTPQFFNRHTPTKLKRRGTRRKAHSRLRLAAPTLWNWPADRANAIPKIIGDEQIAVTIECKAAHGY